MTTPTGPATMKTSLRGDCSPAARLADAAPVVLF
jgi:hypothetical protein